MCAIINKKELLTVKNLEATFYLMDLNHNGRVNAKELSELLKIDKEEVVKDMQTLLDATKTKKVQARFKLVLFGAGDVQGDDVKAD